MLPILVGVIALAFAVRRRWRSPRSPSSCWPSSPRLYRVTTLVVHRDRPAVHRLEGLPVDASYPSGHTAASIAVYSGLALLLTSRFTNGAVRALAWTAAILMTLFVALVAHVPRHAPPARRRRRRAPRHRRRSCSWCSPAAPQARRATARAEGADECRERLVTRVAVIAHAGKTLGGGLPELRRVLTADGVTRPALERGPEEPQGAGAGCAARWRRAPS